ncbi:MAG: glycosyltransferase family 4 protein [Candidatus Micrarchaeota archaeon]
MGEKMRIAILVPFFLPVVGGMEAHAYELARDLKKRGHEPEVLTANMDHSGKKSFAPAEEVGGVECRRYNVWLRFGKFASLWPGFISDLGKYDIIHVQNMRHPHTDLAMIFGKLMGKKVVISPQSPLHEGTHSKLQELLIKFYDNLILPITFRFYDAIFAHHVKEKEYLVRHGAPANKIYVVNLGVGEETFKPCRKGYFSKGGKRILLFVGRLSNMKGLEVLLKAFAFAKLKNWQLVLVGPDGGELGKLKRLQKELNLKNLIFWGAVSENEVERATADADAFILPSQYEPYGLVLIKAMAKGVPCIAVNAGGPSEIILDGKTGLLCKYDPADMAKAMEKMLGNPAMLKRMGKEAEKRARIFTVEEMVDKYELVYEKLLM